MTEMRARIVGQWLDAAESFVQAERIAAARSGFRVLGEGMRKAARRRGGEAAEESRCSWEGGEGGEGGRGEDDWIG